MPSKPAKVGEKTENDGDASIRAVCKANLLAALAEHKTALIAQLNTYFEKFGSSRWTVTRLVCCHWKMPRPWQCQDSGIVFIFCASRYRRRMQSYVLRLRIWRGEIREIIPDWWGCRSLWRDPNLVYFLLNYFRRCSVVICSHPCLSWTKPRPVLLCFHRYPQKDLILREAHFRDSLIYLHGFWRLSTRGRQPAEGV